MRKWIRFLIVWLGLSLVIALFVYMSWASYCPDFMAHWRSWPANTCTDEDLYPVGILVASTLGTLLLLAFIKLVTHLFGHKQKTK